MTFAYAVLAKILIFIFLVLIPIGFIMFLLMTIVKGAPFMTSGKNPIRRIIALAEIKPGQKAADLGSGDGRIVIAMARAGAIAHGYEINPLLVWWSRRKIVREGLSGKAFIHQKSFWNEDFSSFDLISIYGIGYIMKDLEEKLRRELPQGAKVAANAFEFPNWQYAKRDNGIFLYEQK